MLMKIAETEAKEVSKEQFQQALLIWKNKPHVVNRRLLAAIQKFNTVFKLKGNWMDYINESRNLLSDKINQCLNNGLQIDEKIWSFLNNIDDEQSIPVNVCLRYSLMKNPIKLFAIYDAVFYDSVNNIIMTVFLLKEDINHILEIDKVPSFYVKFNIHQSIQLYIDSEFNLELHVNLNSNMIYNSFWIRDVLFKKIGNWCRLNDLNTEKTSLKCVDIFDYNAIYQRLKTNYGIPIANSWSECTDPTKYVFEDVAIAAYLITLWGEYDESKTSNYFIDLGCGNGLLVYILNSEGYIGHGVDLQKRKIWETFQPKADLRQHSIDPETVVFANCTWLIGNHSDELTPWIPIIAGKSNSNFFLLPCCAYDFFNKFQRSSNKTKQLSVYGEYMDFLLNICNKCNYDVNKDILRIPSTKRTCLIGYKSKTSFNQKSMKQFIDARKINESQFISRPIIKVVTASKELQNVIGKKIFNKILSIDTTSTINYKDNKKWKCGGCLELNECFQLLDTDEISQLKNLNGGISTVLKSFPQVFKIIQGQVSLKTPGASRNPTKRKLTGLKLKTKPCWFYNNHPDGCPLTIADCNYAHTNDIYYKDKLECF